MIVYANKNRIGRHFHRLAICAHRLRISRFDVIVTNKDSSKLQTDRAKSDRQKHRRADMAILLRKGIRRSRPDYHPLDHRGSWELMSRFRATLPTTCKTHRNSDDVVWRMQSLLNRKQFAHPPDGDGVVPPNEESGQPHVAPLDGVRARTHAKG